MTNNIHFISAGAGSGKTYTLTEKLEELLGSGEVSPPGVIATTFTRLAAGELKERVRQKLIEKGQLYTANQMEQSLIGTVNGVCGELLRRFTFEAGLPPDQTVLEEAQGNILFYQAMEQALSDNIGLVRQMNAVCYRLQITDYRTNQLHWRREIKAIVNTARANNQGADDIRELGIASADSLIAHFPTPSTRDLSHEMLEAVSQALNGIDLEDDTTKGTYSYYNLLRGTLAAIMKSRLPWAEWIKLSKASTKPTKKSEHWAEPIRNIASDYEKHPQLSEDVRFFAVHAFEIAADSLEAYQTFKTRKGLIDFVDQEQKLYALLGNPVVADTLRDELQLLMVDEFQDTSPIQLALFLKLAQLADRVILVGDIKQSIYGFRGADPALMSAVVERIVADGNEPEILEKSWRSRPELVRYVNALFVPAFQNTLVPEQVHLEPARAPVSQKPAVECWRLVDKNKAMRASALAGGVRQLMANDRTVVDKDTETERPLTHGDIAILCRTHSNLKEVAAALANANLPIRYKRPGLLSTPEGCLALACLRRLIDPFDTLATAEIHSLTSGENPEVWIAERMEYLSNEQNRSHQWLIDDVSSPIARLNEQRQRLPFLTPVETLRIALDAGDVRKAVYHWGPSQQRGQHRLNNLSTLIDHAEEYINQCAAQNEPATSAGLVLWLQALAKSEEDTQATGGDEDAIQLVTHHGAKGLEWPIVVAMDLDATLKPRLWGLTVQPSPDPINLDNPLQGRTLRYWPGFQGPQRSDIPLVERIQSSDEGMAAMEVEVEENKRLLYVSLTRPRDGLVLTMNKKDENGDWMNTLGASWMLPNSDELSLPDKTTIPANYLELEAAETESALPEFNPNWLADNDLNEVKLPLRISPSAEASSEGATIGKIVQVGERLLIEGDYKPDKLGSALHAVISNYINGNQDPETTRRIFKTHCVEKNVSVEMSMLCAERLIKHIEANFSPTRYATEYPVQYTNRNGQRVSGWIDLLVETEKGFIIVDHKITTRENLEEVALGYSGQLAVYAEAVNQASAQDVISCWVHFGVAGKLVQVVC